MEEDMFIRNLDEVKGETLGETFNKVFTLENYRDAERISNYLSTSIEKTKKKIELFEGLGDTEKVKALKESLMDMQSELDSYADYLSICRIMFRKNKSQNVEEDSEEQKI